MKKNIFFYSQVKTYKRFFVNKKVVLVGGCFEIIHYGHFKFLEKAKKEGDFLIVALESDEFISKKKLRKPIHNQDQRAEMLSNLKSVDLIIKLPYFSQDDDYFNLVKLIKPTVIAVTKGDPQIKNKKKQAKSIKAKVKIVVPLFKNFSTTKIVDSFFKNEIIFSNRVT